MTFLKNFIAFLGEATNHHFEMVVATRFTWQFVPRVYMHLTTTGLMRVLPLSPFETAV
jgi:hypothetical protein